MWLVIALFASVNISQGRIEFKSQLQYEYMQSCDLG